jgi:octopine/nopaline transport system permease protein
MELMHFGQGGWAPLMLRAAAMTLAVSATAFLIGLAFGTAGVAGKLGQSRLGRLAADGYTTVVRGVPDLLIIYLFYFGSSALVSMIARGFGATGFVGVPAFLAGALAVAVVSGAYSTEVLRAGYLAIPKGQIEAARACGMSRWLILRRVTGPLTLRYALPGLGNVWQLALKESALVSVTNLVEIMRQAEIGAGSTKKPFTFYLTAALLFLALASLTGWLFQWGERRALRGVRRA